MASRHFGMNDVFGLTGGPGAYRRLVLDKLSTQPRSAWSFARQMSRRYQGPVGRLYRLADGVEADVYGSGWLGLVNPAAITAFGGWNLVPYSDSLVGGSWGALGNGVALTPTVTTGFANPDGDLTATRIVFSLNGGTTADDYSVYRFSGSPLPTAGLSYEFSAWFRSYDGNTYTMQLRMGNTTTAIVVGPTWTQYKSVGSSGSTRWFGIRGDQSGVSPTADILVAKAMVRRTTTPDAYERRTTTAANNVLWSRVCDQTGGGRTFAQSNSDLMPIAARQGVPVTEHGIQSAEFVAADARRMSVASSSALYNFMHTTGGWAFGVSRTNDNTALKCLLRNTSVGTRAGFQITRATTEQWTVGVGRLDVAGVATDGNSVNATTADALTSDNCLIVCNIDPDNPTAGSRVNLWQDGDAKTINNVSTGTPFVEDAQSDLFLGSTSGGTGTWDGTISEVGLGQGSLPAADRLIYEADALDLWAIA